MKGYKGVVDPLSRLHLRRSRGIPTVVLLAGPVGLGINRWERSASEQGIAVARAEDASQIDSAWINCVAGRVDLVQVASALIGRASKRPAEDIAGATIPDLEEIQRGLPPVLAASPAGRLCLGLLRRRDPSEVFNGIEPEQRMAALAGALERKDRPALLLAERRPDRVWLDRAIAALERRLAAAPEIAAAICVCGTSYAEWLEAQPQGSRRAAWVREGWVAVDGLGLPSLEQMLPPTEPPAETTALQRLVDDGIDEPLAERYAAALGAVRQRPLDAGVARSAAERFLFDRLSALPQTAGRFRLNAALPFRHGPAAAEADLLSERDKLVIEVDGAHFHLEPEQYRRDRRKDWLLQQHGYRVLRVLAEDVVDRIGEILDTVLAAVAATHAPRGPSG